jgi:hypothetical protein
MSSPDIGLVVGNLLASGLLAYGINQDRIWPNRRQECLYWAGLAITLSAVAATALALVFFP